MNVKTYKQIFYASILFLILSFTTHTYSQNKTPYTIPDSLKDKSYGYLYKQLYKNINNSKKVNSYLSTYLEKATVNNDTIHRLYALSNLAAYEKDKEKQISLIETAISESKGVENPRLIQVYGIAGIIYSNQYEYEKSLVYRLKALELSKKYESDFYIGLNIQSIATIKSAIGKYDEAISLYKKRYSYLTSTNKRDSLNPIGKMELEISIAEAMRYLKKYDSATYYYNRISSQSINDSLFKTYRDAATINEGINQYYKGNYKDAKEKIEDVCGRINVNDFTTFFPKHYILSQFYLGKLNLALSENEKETERYFLITDSLLDAYNTVIPETREIYEFLSKKYEKEKKYISQIQTINKILVFDSIISERKIKTLNKLHAEYDTPTLLKSKEKAIENLEHTNSSLSNRTTYLITIVCLLGLLLIFQLRKHKIYKKRFNILISEPNSEEKKTRKHKNIDDKEIKIDKDLVLSILNQLKHFEQGNHFLKSNITLNILAKRFSTNTRYLSKIINIYKEKTFIHYINDLRIDYTIRELKNNSKIQHYTIKGISEEAGFNNSESFTAAFKRATGLNPSYFIKHLKKQAKT